MTTSPLDERAAATRRTLTTIALEIGIGFVGVYAAFALAAWHERRELAERRRQIHLALIEEIRDIKRGTGGAAKGVGSWIAQFDSATGAGGSPPLQPVLATERFDTHVWNATQQSGGLLLLDVKTYVRLSAYYNQLARGFDELQRLRERSESVLLPNLDRGSDEFYSVPGRIRPKYAWYPTGMKSLHRIALDVNGQSDSLIALLQRSDSR
jgi:hypothetical protein